MSKKNTRAILEKIHSVSQKGESQEGLSIRQNSSVILYDTTKEKILSEFRPWSKRELKETLERLRDPVFGKKIERLSIEFFLSNLVVEVEEELQQEEQELQPQEKDEYAGFTLRQRVLLEYFSKPENVHLLSQVLTVTPKKVLIPKIYSRFSLYFCIFIYLLIFQLTLDLYFAFFAK